MAPKNAIELVELLRQTRAPAGERFDEEDDFSYSIGLLNYGRNEELSETQATASAGRTMDKAYNPGSVERRWYDWWESQGYFTPAIDRSKQPFTIIAPPPNVTGELHLGHGLTIAIEDTMIRWRRMQDPPTLWLPGFDHAGIHGQYVVEKELARHDLRRQDIGREQFLEHAWTWMRKYIPIISNQFRRLGASCDWTRARFTMDAGPSRAVRTVFKHLFDKGLIYR